MSILGRIQERFLEPSNGDSEEGEWIHQETRQAYRILSDTEKSIKVESYEVAIFKHTETGEAVTEVQDYLRGDWYLKDEIDQWPDPVAQAYMSMKIESGLPMDDFWVL